MLGREFFLGVDVDRVFMAIDDEMVAPEEVNCNISDFFTRTGNLRILLVHPGNRIFKVDKRVVNRPILLRRVFRVCFHVLFGITHEYRDIKAGRIFRFALACLPVLSVFSLCDQQVLICWITARAVVIWVGPEAGFALRGALLARGFIDLILIVFEVDIATLDKRDFRVLPRITLKCALFRVRSRVEEADVAVFADLLPIILIPIVVTLTLGAPLRLEKVLGVEFSQVALLANFDPVLIRAVIPLHAL